MDLSTFWRATLLQLVTVAVLFVALALALPKEFFVDWGWLVGPLAWLGCAAISARVLALPLNPTLLGAVIAGIPSLLALVVNAHEAGIFIAVILFGLWCGRLKRRELAL